MGKLLYHTHPCLPPEPVTPNPDLAATLTRDERKQLFKSLQGASTLANPRQPFIGQVKTFQSPDHPEDTFDIKRAGTLEHLARQNLAATMRYITREASGEFVQERDLPTGDLKMSTILLVLCGWNLGDGAGNPLAINEQTVTQYLSPREFEFVYEKALECNPTWANGGEEEIKNDSAPSTPTSSES